MGSQIRLALKNSARGQRDKKYGEHFMTSVRLQDWP